MQPAESKARPNDGTITVGMNDHATTKNDGQPVGGDVGVRISPARRVSLLGSLKERISGSGRAPAAPLAGAEGVKFGHRMDQRIKEVFERFDTDGDGTLDLMEVTAMVEKMLAEQQQSKWIKMTLIGLTIFTFMLIAVMAGLTYTIVAALKDTKLDGGVVMISKDGGGIIQVGNSDFTMLPDGSMVIRNATVNPRRQLLDGSKPTSVVRTSGHPGLKQGLSSAMDIDSLMELNFLHIDATGGGQVALKVLGVARVPMPQSQLGSVVNILTTAGTVVLDGSDIAFEQAMENVFASAGFTSKAQSSGSRRQLLGKPVISGLYNRMVDMPTQVVPPVPSTIWEITAKDKDEARAASQELKNLHDKGGSDASFAAAWKGYKLAFNKVYANYDEDYAAFTAWKAATYRLVATNFDSSTEHWASLNQYSDMNYATFASKILMKASPPLSSTRPVNNETLAERHRMAMRHRSLLGAKAQVPAEVDWVAAGKVTPVKDQGNCGDCWAFATVATVESAYMLSPAGSSIKNPADINFSEQHLTNCVNANTPQALIPDYQYMGLGCNGGDSFESLSYIQEFGLATETMSPLTVETQRGGVAGACDATLARKKGAVQLRGEPLAVYPFASRNALKQAVAVQPISITFMVDESFMQYRGGVFTPTTCTNATNHAMVLIGYNTTAPVPYWIIRNSWGPGWGEKGYAYVRMGPERGDPNGPCGLYMTTAYPPLDFQRTLTA